MKVLLIAGFIVSLLRASNGECIMCVMHLSMLCPTTPHPGNGGEYVGI